MLILVNAACVECGAELSAVTGAIVIEWLKPGPGVPEELLDQPAIYMRCRNRAACAANQKETTAHDA